MQQPTYTVYEEVKSTGALRPIGRHLSKAAAVRLQQGAAKAAEVARRFVIAQGILSHMITTLFSHMAITSQFVTKGCIERSGW